MLEQENGLSPIEGYIVSPEQIKRRTMAFFDGIDLSKSGIFKNGLIDVHVSSEENFQSAVAKVNDIWIAQFKKVDKSSTDKSITGAPEGTIAQYRLFGYRGLELTLYERKNDLASIVELEPRMEEWYDWDDLAFIDNLGVKYNRQYVKEVRKRQLAKAVQ